MKLSTRAVMLLGLALLFSFLSFGQQRALKFDGTNDYVNINGVVGPMYDVRNHFSIEFWMKGIAAQQSQLRTTMFAINEATHENRLLINMGGLNSQDGHLMIYANDGDNLGNSLIWESTDLIGDDACHHIAYTYDGVNHIGKVYIDGELKDAHDIVINLTLQDRYSIGQDYDNNQTSDYFNGTISNVRLWGYIKSDAEISQNMYTIYDGTENGFVALYTLNQGIANGNNTAITQAIDLSPNAIHGTIMNFALNGTNSNFVPAPCVAQNSALVGTFQSTINHICNGSNCHYEGPSILINELMVSPTLGDGSISSVTTTPLSSQRGEWIELYNPNLCEPIDIGCYYLGNFTNEGNGGFIIPPGTIVPPAGFCILRGLNAPTIPANLLVQNGGNTVEIVFPAYITNEGICASGQRVWFPNAGGWFAFYNRDGEVQDAVAWGNGNIADRNGQPCVPTRSACGSITSLASFNEIPDDRKFVATNVPAGNHMDLSIRRATDGGPWNNYGTPTYGTCNATCIDAGVSTCDGTATITVSGGTAPYQYLWNDSQTQMTPTAVGLCAGEYTVTVTDAANQSQQFSVTITDFVPTVSATIQQSVCIDSDPVTVTVNPQPQGDAVGNLTGNGASNFQFSPLTAGVGQHTLTYTYADENECQNSATTTIRVDNLPTLNWDIQPQYCIPATQAHTLALQPTGGTLTGPGTTATAFNPNIAGAGQHLVQYSFTDQNNCSNQIEATVNVVQTVQAQIQSLPHLCIDDDIYTPTTNLPQGTLTINGTNINNGLLPSQFGVGTHTMNYAGVDDNNCPSITNLPIEIRPLPDLTIHTPSKFCSNEMYVPLDASPMGGAFTGDLISNSFLVPHQGLEGVNYSFTYAYTDNYGCSNTKDHPFTIVKAVEPVMDYTTDCFFNAIVTANSSNFQALTWSTDATKVENRNEVYYFNYAVEGQYQITAYGLDLNGCRDTSVMLVDVPVGLKLPDYQVPNVITANNDNINDEIMMSAKFDECLDYEIVFINRWGQHVYTATKSDRFRGLDFGGTELPEGVYFYEVKSEEVEYNTEMYKPYRSGFITIIR